MLEVKHFPDASVCHLEKTISKYNLQQTKDIANAVTANSSFYCDFVV